MTQAETVTYTLTGGAAISCPSCVGSNLEAYKVDLVDASTGLSSLPGFTLNVGDTIDGTVTLSTPLTVPAGAGGNGVVLLIAGDGKTTFNYTDSLSFYDNGVQVAPPSQWSNFNSEKGALVPAAFSFSLAPTPAFTFDQLAFEATVTGMLDQNNNPINTVNLGTFVDPVLQADVNPVPLPATVWLLLSGIGGLAAVLAKRKVA
jgi:hypothetical protein